MSDRRRQNRAPLINSLCAGLRKDGGRCLQWKTNRSAYCRFHQDQDPQLRLA